MSHPVRQRWKAVFGSDEFARSTSPWWLRIRFDEFDHAGEAAYLLQATDRLRAVTFAAFADSPQVTALLHWLGGASARQKPPFADLKALGLDLPKTPDIVTPHEADPDAPDDDYVTNTHVLTLTPDLESLAPLFVQAVTPWRRSGGYTNLWFELADFERGVAIEYYDNKGMVVMAATPEPLLLVYRRFRDWTWEPQRELFDERFGALATI